MWQAGALISDRSDASCRHMVWLPRDSWLLLKHPIFLIARSYPSNTKEHLSVDEAGSDPLDSRSTPNRPRVGIPAGVLNLLLDD